MGEILVHLTQALGTLCKSDHPLFSNTRAIVAIGKCPIGTKNVTDGTVASSLNAIVGRKSLLHTSFNLQPNLLVKQLHDVKIALIWFLKKGWVDSFGRNLVED
ncbi:hypothetical protein CEXT_178531 [Caerostris extrusa]|uniref:Uncharacterized protein n=1 Tax=Caerostris extrusa TaxID=172846 RepID=A0AAV4Q1N9_CAEEX|nr:hypothetical protein CEXT_178531 [Caerostris extrusa]